VNGAVRALTVFDGATGPALFEALAGHPDVTRVDAMSDACVVAATLAVLGGLSVAVPSSRLCDWRVGRGVGLAMAGAYVVSQAAFAAVEGFG
jgi:hypothetical protein